MLAAVVVSAVAVAPMGMPTVVIVVTVAFVVVYVHHHTVGADCMFHYQRMEQRGELPQRKERQEPPG